MNDLSAEELRKALMPGPLPEKPRKGNGLFAVLIAVMSFVALAVAGHVLLCVNSCFVALRDDKKAADVKRE